MISVRKMNIQFGFALKIFIVFIKFHDKKITFDIINLKTKIKNLPVSAVICLNLVPVTYKVNYINFISQGFDNINMNSGDS